MKVLEVIGDNGAYETISYINADGRAVLRLWRGPDERDTILIDGKSVMYEGYCTTALEHFKKALKIEVVKSVNVKYMEENE